jgi:RND family efflux transporter MFP subunit
MSRPQARSRCRALIICGALLVASIGCRQEAPPPDLPPRAIQWQRVSGTVAGEQRVISGIVTAVTDTKLAFEVGGTVDLVEVDLGDFVEKGQRLARLDPEPFELAVRDAEAALAETRALQELARSTVVRYEEAGAAISRQELDQARAMRDARDQQVKAAVARLNLTRRDLRRSVLVAPFRGSVSSREIDPAMKVANGQTAFELDSEESGLRVEVQMPETLIARVHQGDEVEVGFPSIGEGRSDLGDRRFPAVVSEVGSRAGTGNAFPVRADLLAAPPGLRPGMTAEATFSVPRFESGLVQLEGFLVPIAAAFAEADDRFSVFVYDPDTSTVSKRPIRTGGVRENDIAVIEGLAEGDIIATAGVPFLSDGQQVTLLEHGRLRTGP